MKNHFSSWELLILLILFLISVGLIIYSTISINQFHMPGWHGIAYVPDYVKILMTIASFSGGMAIVYIFFKMIVRR